MGIADVSSFVDSVRTRPNPDHNRRIVEALTTNETSWFRDGDPFTALTSTVMPALLAARGPNERLQIWSAACSSGQEPYTIAMLLEDAIPNAASRVSITATDLSREMVERTKAGRFTQLEVNRGLPAPMLVRHFTRAGSEWEVAPQLRRMITASECNLAAPLPRMGPFDVVYLRNVLHQAGDPPPGPRTDAPRRMAFPRCGRDDARGGRLLGAGRRRPKLRLPPAEGELTCVHW
jgi:chemotaxis protein methyltransferase CheR